MSKIKNSGLDQYDIEPFEQQQFGPAGVEGVNINLVFCAYFSYSSNSGAFFVPKCAFFFCKQIRMAI